MIGGFKFRIMGSDFVLKKREEVETCIFFLYCKSQINKADLRI